jgi:hypothetical protein
MVSTDTPAALAMSANVVPAHRVVENSSMAAWTTASRVCAAWSERREESYERFGDPAGMGLTIPAGLIYYNMTQSNTDAIK